MPLPGISEENELKPLLKKLLQDKEEVYKFAVVASGPKDGQLILDKKQKLKKKEVQVEAEAEAKKNGSKGGKLDVMTGECRQDASNATTLRLIVYGKAPPKAVACMEHLLVRGPYKSVGFANVILEEVEEPSEAPAAPPAPPATANPDPLAPTAPKDAAVGDPTAQFSERLKALLPAIKAAAGTASGDEAKLRASEAGVFARKQDFAQANLLLDQVETLLKAKPAATAVDDPTSQFSERLKALLPAIKAAAGTAPGDEAKLRASEAGVFARKQDFAQANLLLDQVETLLKAKPAATVVGDPTAQFNERLKALLPAIKAAAGTAPGDEAKLRASEAGVFARKQDFAQANLLLDQVEALLKPAAPVSPTEASSATASDTSESSEDSQQEPLEEPEDELALAAAPPPPPGPSNVPFIKARLEWETARNKVRAELERFEKTVLAAVRDESDAADITEKAKNVYDILEILDTSLIDKLDELLNEEEAARRLVLRKEAAAIVEEYTQYVATDPLVQNIDDNPFIPVKVRSTLETALAGLRSKLR